MRRRRRGAARAAQDAGGLVTALSRYWLRIYPIARREIERWRDRAEQIANPLVGAVARKSLEHEGLNAEGAALFAMLAPRALRTPVVRLLVCFQVMYDYLDALTEQPLENLLPISRQLHRALGAALGAPPPAQDYYVHHPHGDDGGYLEELVMNCRATFLALPAARVVAPFAVRAVERSAEGQSHSHAAVSTSREELVRWATRATPRSSGLYWWETAAASESSLVVHALLASAANPALTADAARRIANAYWPWVTGLNALLDDLVDLEEDLAEGTHSYVAHYPTPEIATRRLGAFAERAGRVVRCLPQGHRHTTILAAMTGFYLSAPGADAPAARGAAREVRDQLGTDLRLLLATVRLRRRLASRGR
jgi:tetraprenyl-beta-curcumene synthase